MLKLSPITILLIGVSVAIIAISFAFFKFYQPNMAGAAAYRATIEQLQVEIGKHNQVIKAREDTVKTRDQLIAKWRSIVETRTPAATLAGGGIDLSVNAWQLAIDAPKYRNSIQKAVNNQLTRGGIKVITAPVIPDPKIDNPNGILANYFNYGPVKYPIVIFDLGEITVEGTFEQIANHLRAYSSMPNYLAVTDGLRLEGTSPTLRGTYALTIVGYLHGTTILPDVPQGGPATGNRVPGAPGGALTR